MSRRAQAGAGAEEIRARLTPEEQAARARYETLTPAEQGRVCRLIAHTGCTLAMAVAAVLAVQGEGARP